MRVVIYIICLTHVPDTFKGMMKGLFKALVLQRKLLLIHLFGYWVLNFMLCYLFAFYFNFKLRGIWLNLFCQEIFIIVAYNVLLFYQDWESISQ